ncbi:hypothetical protein ANK1_1891 [plant metagenome]|uniref:Uncharacterized protein n=1 Tax=plant metagenome TaxID=1297885 RepID=A0A484SB08_9ZZZZ
MGANELEHGVSGLGRLACRRKCDTRCGKMKKGEPDSPRIHETPGATGRGAESLSLCEGRERGKGKRRAGPLRYPCACQPPFSPSRPLA